MKFEYRKGPPSGGAERGLWHWLSAGVKWRYQALVGRLKAQSGAPIDSLEGNPYVLGSGRYDAERYWANRHNQYRHSFRGVGDITRSEEENIQDYAVAANTITELLGTISFNPRGKRALDVGCGNGFWTGVLRDWGVTTYTGVDITDVMFDLLRGRYPMFEFVAGKFQELPIGPEFELITMIDVTQHITDDIELTAILQRVRSLLATHGVFVVTFWNHERSQENFYETFRLFHFYTAALPGMAYTQPTRFRDKFVSAFFNPGRCPDPLPILHLPFESIAAIAKNIVAT